MSNVYPLTSNMLFIVSKNGGGVEKSRKKKEKQGNFSCIKPWLFLKKKLPLQPKLSEIGILPATIERKNKYVVGLKMTICTSQ